MEKTMQNISKTKLKQAKVSIIDEQKLVLLCDECKSQWSPLRGKAEIPKDYWRCPAGCNA